MIWNISKFVAESVISRKELKNMREISWKALNILESVKVMESNEKSILN